MLIDRCSTTHSNTPVERIKNISLSRAGVGTEYNYDGKLCRRRVKAIEKNTHPLNSEKTPRVLSSFEWISRRFSRF